MKVTFLPEYYTLILCVLLERFVHRYRASFKMLKMEMITLKENALALVKDLLPYDVSVVKH